jgi:hypothetical protein
LYKYPYPVPGALPQYGDWQASIPKETPVLTIEDPIVVYSYLNESTMDETARNEVSLTLSNAPETWRFDTIVPGGPYTVEIDEADQTKLTVVADSDVVSPSVTTLDLTVLGAGGTSIATGETSVVVLPYEDPVLSATAVSVMVGDTETTQLTITASDGTVLNVSDYTLSVTSPNTGVATCSISESGVITVAGVSKGTTKLEVTASLKAYPAYTLTGTVDVNVWSNTFSFEQKPGTGGNKPPFEANATLYAPLGEVIIITADNGPDNNSLKWKSSAHGTGYISFAGSTKGTLQITLQPNTPPGTYTIIHDQGGQTFTFTLIIKEPGT